MPPGSNVFEVSDTVPQFVASTFVLAQPNVAVHVAARKASTKDNKDGRGNPMKWQPFLSMFVLNRLCGIIASGVRTDKGFKEVHLNTVAK